MTPDPATAAAAVPDVVPARMLNEFAYCPRLAYLQWVQQEWADSADTLEGKEAHQRVDRAEGPRAEIHQRSLHLTSERLGLTAVCDLVESEGRRVRPVDYKRGKKPAVDGGAWEPERVQLCVQGLLLREHGYECHEGILYYVGSKERQRVRFTPQLEERTLELLAQMRAELAAGIPAPLEDSRKCPRCSLVGICLPEEVNFLRRGGDVRPLAVADPAAWPLTVQVPGAQVRLRGDRLLVLDRGKQCASARLGELSQVVLMSGAAASSGVLRECCKRGIPVVHMSGGGWFYGLTQGLPHKNVELRAAQFAAAGDGERSLALARRLVAAKIHNSRVLVRRNGEPGGTTLGQLRRQVDRAEKAADVEQLLGCEGSAAQVYFSAFDSMLKGGAVPAFDFTRRSRRPPQDPLNALLSFAYSLLTKDWTVVLYTVGFDPMMGFYHQPRYGKPALALDMMEPFRPVIAESVVIGAVNNGEIDAGDFYERMGGVLLKPPARKRLIEAYERRLKQEIEHPVFGYRCTYRRIFELEARLLARYLLGEIAELPGFRVR
jgi:CRISPR-associated endonuclease Cas1/CRISPR-associated protein Cas4